MVYKTSRPNKQDIRNKVTTKSRTVKQVPTIAKTHSGRHRLHRHHAVPGGTLPRHRLCQDVTALRWLQQLLLEYQHPPQPLLTATAIVCPVSLPEVWPWVLQGHRWNMLCGKNFPFFLQSPTNLWSLLVCPSSIPPFPSGHFKCYSAFTVVILIPPVIPVLPSSSASFLLPRTHDFSQLKIRRSLLKERTKHLFHLMAPTMATEEHHYLRSVESHL